MNLINDLARIFKKGGYPALLKALDSCKSEGLSYADIAKILNTTASDVRNVEHVALRKLQHPRNSKTLRWYIKETVTPDSASIYEDCSI